MARISNYGLSNYGLDAPQSDSAVSAIENSPEVAAQYAAIDRLQHAKDVTKRYIDQMGQATTETPGGIFGRKWSYGDKVYTDQQLADAKSAVDRAQNDNEIYQAIRNLANANDQSEVGTGWGGELARGMNNTPIASIGNNSLLGNNRTKYEYPEDDSSWAYAIGKYGGGGLELASDLAGAGGTLKMAKAARFNPFTFAGMLYRDAKQTGKDIVNLPRNIVNGIRNAGSKTSDFVKDSIKAGTEGKSLKAYRTPASTGETAQTGGRAAETAETAAPAAERTAASEAAAPAGERTAASETAAPAAERTAAPAPERTAPAEGSPELRSNENGTPDLADAINGGGRAGEAAGGAPKTGAGEVTDRTAQTGGANNIDADGWAHVRDSSYDIQMPVDSDADWMGALARMGSAPKPAPKPRRGGGRRKAGTK